MEHKERNHRNQKTNRWNCDPGLYPCDDYRWTFNYGFLFPESTNIRSRTEYRNQTTQPAYVPRDDSVPSAIVMSVPRKPILR